MAENINFPINDYLTTNPEETNKTNLSMLWWVYQAFAEEPNNVDFSALQSSFLNEQGISNEELLSSDFDNISTLQAFSRFIVNNLPASKLSSDVTLTTPTSNFNSSIQVMLQKNLVDIGNEKYSIQMNQLLNGVIASQELSEKLTEFFDLYAKQSDTGASIQGVPDSLSEAATPYYLSKSLLDNDDYYRLNQLYEDIQSLVFTLPDKSITASFGEIDFTNTKNQIVGNENSVLADFSQYYIPTKDYSHDETKFTLLKTRWQQDLDGATTGNDKVAISNRITNALAAVTLFNGDLKENLSSSLLDYQEFYKLAGGMLDRIDKILAKISLNI